MSGVGSKRSVDALASSSSSPLAGPGPEKRPRVVPAEGVTAVPSDGLSYLSGFGNEFATEALPGALPKGQNNPQVCPYGLIAEQLSGTAFTVPRAGNLRTWFYRIRPSVSHGPFSKVEHEGLVEDFSALKLDPSQMRWFPPPLPKPSPSSSSSTPASPDFVEGLRTIGGNGSPGTNGIAFYYYTASSNMGKKAFYSSDGDFLIVPQEGRLVVRSEMGLLTVAPREICVLPRGVKFSVDVEGPSRGYVAEVFAGHFKLPDLGPLGSNGLANPRDFQTPVAWYEDDEGEGWEVWNKFGGGLFRANLTASPFDVVAWHGNYVPFKYNLDLFNCMNSVTFDHPDPSIYTVLTCPTPTPGVALIDFVIFPPRWMVMDHTFRPPWYHRNVMTEFMGMVYGKYDAKVGFQPGGASLHSCMTPHGPDAPTFKTFSAKELEPEFFGGGLAFMFETSLTLRLSPYALEAPFRDTSYHKCWEGIPKIFDPTKPTMRFPSDAGAAAGGGGGGGGGGGEDAAASAAESKD